MRHQVDSSPLAVEFVRAVLLLALAAFAILVLLPAVVELAASPFH